MKILFPRTLRKSEGWSDELNKDILDIYSTWYEKYIEIIKYISNISTAMFIFSSTFLMSDFMNRGITKGVGFDEFTMFFRGLFIIFMSVVFSFVCILSTYNWFRSILEKIKESSELNYNSLVNDNIYSDRRLNTSSNTRVWGAVSWVCGYLAGILLIVGLAVYGLGVWHVVTVVLDENHVPG
jgi:hypothetical protein